MLKKDRDQSIPSLLETRVDGGGIGVFVAGKLETATGIKVAGNLHQLVGIRIF